MTPSTLWLLYQCEDRTAGSSLAAVRNMVPYTVRTVFVVLRMRRLDSLSISLSMVSQWAVGP